MAEILDVITNLTYNVEDGDLQNAVKSINSQIDLISQLQAQNTKLDQQLKKVAQEDLAARKKISAAIADNAKKIDEVTVAIGKEFAANERLQSSIQNQIGQINGLNLQYTNLLRLRDASTDTREIEQYNAQLAQTKNRLQALYQTGVTGAREFNTLQFASSQIIREIPAFAFSAQTGLLAISNNIPILIDELNKAKSAGSSTTEIFKSLGKSLFSMNSIITLSVAALVIFGDKLFAAGKDAKKAREEVEKFEEARIKTQETALRRIDEQINRERLLISLINDSRTSEEQRASAVQELRKAYPGLLKDVTESTKDIPFLRLLEFTKEVEKQITAREQAKAASEDLVLVQERLRKQQDELTKAVVKNKEAQVQLTSAQRSYNEATDPQTKGGLGSALDAAQANAEKAKKNVDALTESVRKLNIEEGNLRQRAVALTQSSPAFDDPDAKPIDPDEIYRKAQDNLENAQERQLANDEILVRLLQQEQQLNEQYRALYEADNAANLPVSQDERELREERYSQEQQRINTLRDLRINELEQQLTKEKIELNEAFNKATEVAKLEAELRQLQLDGSNLRLQQSQQADIIPTLGTTGTNRSQRTFKPIPKSQIDALGKEIVRDALNTEEDVNKQRVENAIDTYTQITNIAANAYNAIANAQISALDREISARQQRVAQAMELAKNGNSELLKLEQERLDESIREREQYARRQAVINAALTVSQSLLAIATAAGQSGAGAIAIVPAVIAAIAAGFGAVTALAAENTASFAEGVVGFEGKGTEKSDSNVVRISRGESVITAEATKKYRKELEAMNAGTYDMITAPKYTQSNTNSYATKVELTGVENKLNTLIDLTENNGVNVKQVMDAYGLSQVVEKNARRSRAPYNSKTYNR